MTVYVVRHACAGDKDHWPGEDDLRPLDEAGQQQADGLADLLARRPVRRILTSPSLRCVQSVVPLAARTGLAVEETTRLDQGTDLAEVARLLVDPGNEHAVLCTHGEVMRPLLAWLGGLDALVDADDPSEDSLLRKGTAWALDLTTTPALLWHVVPDAPVDCALHPSWPT